MIGTFIRIFRLSQTKYLKVQGQAFSKQLLLAKLYKTFHDIASADENEIVIREFLFGILITFYC